MDKKILKNLPIGVFDSGVGGLTVLRALQKTLPHESFIYLGDTARLPYGTKSPEIVIRYAMQVSEILIRRGIKLLVVACNTASALALTSLQQNFLSLPIVGVLEPGAKAACLASQTGYIAVIATEATVKAGGYQKAIKKIRPDAKVIAQSCGLFVALAEEGLIDDEITAAVVKRYLNPMLTASTEGNPDCLVLGCTHFPVLLQSIKKVVGPQIKIVDSAQTTAEEVFNILNEHSLLTTQNHQPTKFLVTDAPERFANVAQHFLGINLPMQAIELVDFV